MSKAKELQNSHKNIFGFLSVLELKVKNSKSLNFKVIFLCEKSTESFSIFFLALEYKKEYQLLSFFYIDNFNSLYSCIPKRGPNFQPLILKQPKGQNYF